MSEPIGTWRYRLSLSTTVKEGYRVGDVTVEFTESEPGTGTKEEREALSHEFQIRLLERIKDGARVAAQMNRQNDLATTTNVTAPINRKEQHND